MKLTTSYICQWCGYKFTIKTGWLYQVKCKLCGGFMPNEKYIKQEGDDK